MVYCHPDRPETVQKPPTVKGRGGQSRIAWCTVAVSRGAHYLRLAARSPDSLFYRSLARRQMASVLAPVGWSSESRYKGMQYRGDTDAPWRKRQLHRLTAPLLGKGRQGSSRSAEDAIGTFQRFRGRDVTAQVVPRGRTVVTFSLQCYGLILAEMNPDEHSQGIVW